MFFLVLVVAFGAYLAYRGTSPEDRQRFLEEVVHPAAVRLDALVDRARPFRATLQARTPRLIATPVLVGLNTLTFLAMLFGDGSFDSYATLIDWGANHGPRTTNGEWWRLLTAMFVQGGPFHFLFILIGLVQVAELLERLLGGPVVAGVYLMAGLFGGLASLVDHPLAVHAGPSASIFGLFGLLLALTLWSALRPTALAIPLPIYQMLGPAAVVFFVYTSIADGIVNRPNLVGLVVGAFIGLAIMMLAGERKVAPRPYGIGIAAATALAMAIAWPLRGIVDVRSDLVELVANENREATAFRLMLGQFSKRQVPIDRRRLAAVIERTFVPHLADARGRIGRLQTTLADHRVLIAAAAEYARLREESWRLRAEGLRSGKMDVLREADRIERASLDAFKALLTVQQTYSIHL